jgi:hypothetical protein
MTRTFLDNIKANVSGTDANRGIGTNYAIGTILETPDMQPATRKAVKVSAKKSAHSQEKAQGITTIVNESKKPNVVPQQVNIPASTPDHLNPKSHTVVINCVWKDMQKLAKGWGIKAGGRGVTSDVLHTWLCDFQKLGADGFAAKHPEAVKKAETKNGSTSSKEVASNHAVFNGLTFRESQALVKSKGWKVDGVKANSWDGLNKLAVAHAK